MKSCVFIALIVVFITVLFEKSHCLPTASKTDTEDDDISISDYVGLPIANISEIYESSTDFTNNSSVAVAVNTSNKETTISPFPKVVVHALDHVANISEIYENGTDFTNNSSVAGAVVNDNKETVSSPPKVEKYEQDNKKRVKDTPLLLPDGGKNSKTESSAKLPTDKKTSLPGQDISSVTTTVSSAAKKTILRVPVHVQQPEVNQESAQDTGVDLHPTVGQETVPPMTQSPPEAKPADTKPQIESSDEKDDLGGDDEQPDLVESINGVLQTDEKKEPPAATIPNEKQLVKTQPEQVDSHDKKVDDVLPKPMFPEQENSHFFVYFMTIVAICVLGYFLFHNKQKIIALIVEGRHDRRRRAHSYRKLESEGTKGSPAIF